MGIIRFLIQALLVAVLLTGVATAQTVIDPRHDPANPAAKESPQRHQMPSLMENAQQAILEDQNAPSSTRTTNTGMKGMKGMEGMKDMPGMTTNAAPAASTTESMKDMPGMTTNAAPAASTDDSASAASTPSVTLSPLYIHVLINHIPELGLGSSLFALFLGLVFRSREARRVGLILVFLCAASAWPVLRTGQKGYNAIYFSIEPTDQAWLDAHMRTAEKWIWAFYVLAALALVAIVCPLKWPRSEMTLVLMVLLLGAGTFALSGYIAYLGGRVRHVEFRKGPPPIVKHE